LLEVDLVEAGVRRGMREESLRLLDEQHILLARRELQFVALRREPRRRGAVEQRDLGPPRLTPLARLQILCFAAVDAIALALDDARVRAVGLGSAAFAVSADRVGAIGVGVVAFAVVRCCGGLRPVTRSITGGELADSVHRAYELTPSRCRGNEPRRRGAEGFDSGRNVGERVEHPDEASDFLLGPVPGASEHFAQILGREVGSQHQEASEVELASGDGVE
jgi:hypothetical protein